MPRQPRGKEQQGGQVDAEATTFKFSKGLVTEVSPLGYEPETAVDISNFELLNDGSVRRRRGLKQRGSTYIGLGVETAPLARNGWSWTRWKPGSPYVGTGSFIVVHIGGAIQFYRDNIDLAANKLVTRIYLRAYKSMDDTANVGSQPISFCVINGDLICSGADIHTFYVRCLDTAGTVFKTDVIYPIVRDFIGAKDDISDTYRPNNFNGEYTEEHRYNLRNRGWPDRYNGAVPAQRFGISKYIYDSTAHDTAPGKNQIPWKGFIREALGTSPSMKEWNSVSVNSEVYGESSAPTGHIKNYLWLEGDIQYAVGLTQYLKFGLSERPFNQLKIASVDTSLWIPGTFCNTTFTINEDPAVTRAASYHPKGRPYVKPPPATAGDVINILGSKFSFTNPATGITYTWTMDGFYEVNAAAGAGPWTLTVLFYVPEYANLASTWEANGVMYIPFRQTVTLGANPFATSNEEVITNKIVKNVFHTNKASLNAAYAGRLWLANYPTTPTTLYFSKVVLDDTDYARFHQLNDPTADVNSNLLPDDGGTIVIPDCGSVTKMVPFGSYLFVFCKYGVWTIGGSDGYFSADAYFVRKISDVGTDSVLGIVVADGNIYYANPSGFYTIGFDEQTGLPIVNSLTKETIQKRWNTIKRMSEVQVYYDSILKRLFIIYGEDEVGWDSLPVHNIGNRWLIYDITLQAWFAYNFNTGGTGPGTYCFYGAVVLESYDSANDYRKLVCFIVNSGGGTSCTSFRLCDFGTVDYGPSATPYMDYNSIEQIPFIITGYDAESGNWTLKRQAPYIHTYMKKTEEGFFDMGDDTYQPIRESYLTLQAQWDWTDRSVGKWGTPQNCYKHHRFYTPESSTDPFNDGYPVVVSKLKVRGTGRALSLRFEGAPGKDAHLLGWSIHYKFRART